VGAEALACQKKYQPENTSPYPKGGEGKREKKRQRGKPPRRRIRFLRKTEGGICRYPRTGEKKVGGVGGDCATKRLDDQKSSGKLGKGKRNERVGEKEKVIIPQCKIASSPKKKSQQAAILRGLRTAKNKRDRTPRL